MYLAPNRRRSTAKHMEPQLRGSRRSAWWEPWAPGFSQTLREKLKIPLEIGQSSIWEPLFWSKKCAFFDSPNGGFTNADQWENTPEAQWEFQDPKMGVLYHIRPYLVGIFPYIGLIIIGLICGWYLQFKILEWPLISRSLWASPQVWAVVLKTPSNRKICPFLTPSAPTGYHSSIHNGYIMIGCLMQISSRYQI